MKKIIFGLFAFLFVTLTLTACINFNHEQATLDKIKERDKLIVGVKTDSKPFGYKNEKVKLSVTMSIWQRKSQKIFWATLTKLNLLKLLRQTEL